MGKYIDLTETQINEMVTMYKNNIPMMTIAERFNISKQTVKRRLEKRNDIVFRGNRKHFYNETIFEVIDSPEKAYWLGFILADGYVNEDRCFMNLKLSDKDEGHLIKFINFIDGDMGMLHEEYHNLTGNRMVYVNASGKTFTKTLISHNIRQRKSGVEQWSDKVPEEYIRDYIRGIIDADGCIRKKNISIYGSKEVLGNIQDFLTEKFLRDETKICNHDNTFALYITTKRKEILNHIYYDNCVSLDRKYKKVKELYS